MKYGHERVKITNIKRNVLPHDSPYWWNGEMLLMVQRLHKDKIRQVLFYREQQPDLETEKKIQVMVPKVLQLHQTTGVECRFNEISDTAYQATGAMDIYVSKVAIDYMNSLWYRDTHFTLADGCLTVAMWSGPIGTGSFNGFLMTHDSPDAV